MYLREIELAAHKINKTCSVPFASKVVALNPSWGYGRSLGGRVAFSPTNPSSAELPDGRVSCGYSADN